LQKLNADSSVVETSASVQLTTMDTTSHNFTWQINTLGTHSSVLYDVAIINDTLVYAVGEIFHRDSSENWTFFNLAKWNGRDWTLHRVYYRGNNIIHTRWILAFAWNDIWITPYTHWDGTTWREVPFDPIFSGVGTNKAWGTSSSDFYVVGDGGFIAHYDGVRWRRVESGTTLPLQDVLGSYNRSSSRYEILAVASDPFHGFARRIVNISGQTAVAISDSGIVEPLSGVWFVPGRRYYVVGSGIYQKPQLGLTRWRNRVLQFTQYYSNAVRGTTLNEVVVVGAFRDLVHFNGWSWRTYPEIIGSGSWFSVSVRGKKVIAVGAMASQAIVLRGQFN
jgi:hypothetical protein